MLCGISPQNRKKINTAAQAGENKDVKGQRLLSQSKYNYNDVSR
jgi:hypothetical protein